MHGFWRRQIGNLQIHRQRTAARAGLCSRLPPRYGSSGGNPEDGLFDNFQESFIRFPKTPADSEPGAYTRLRDSAPDAIASIHQRVQRMASAITSDHASARVYREALLSARVGRSTRPTVGRTLAGSFHSGSYQRFSGARAQVRQSEADQQLSASRL